MWERREGRGDVAARSSTPLTVVKQEGEDGDSMRTVDGVEERSDSLWLRV